MIPRLRGIFPVPRLDLSILRNPPFVDHPGTQVCQAPTGVWTCNTIMYNMVLRDTLLETTLPHRHLSRNP